MTEFYKNSQDKKPGIRHACKVCFKVALWKRRGVQFTVEEYERLLSAQQNACRICQRPFSPDRKLCVDHCHATGVIRGLLCDLCNKGLGQFKDNTELLERATKYLRGTLHA